MNRNSQQKKIKKVDNVPDKTYNIGMETEEILNEIGDRIASRRKSMNLTQKQLSEKIGISQQAQSKAEGGANLTLSTLLAIMQGTGIEFSFIFKDGELEILEGK